MSKMQSVEASEEEILAHQEMVDGTVFLREGKDDTQSDGHW